MDLHLKQGVVGTFSGGKDNLKHLITEIREKELHMWLKVMIE